MFNASKKKRQAAFVSLMSDMGVSGSGGGQVLGASTKAHADAYKVTWMPERFEKSLSYMSPGSEGQLIARNSLGAMPLHYVACALNDEESDVRLWATLGLLALVDRQDKDEQEWVDQARAMGHAEGLPTMLQEAKEEHELETYGPEWAVSDEEREESVRGMKRLAGLAQQLLARATGVEPKVVLGDAGGVDDDAGLGAAGAIAAGATGESTVIA